MPPLARRRFPEPDPALALRVLRFALAAQVTEDVPDFLERNAVGRLLEVVEHLLGKHRSHFVGVVGVLKKALTNQFLYFDRLESGGFLRARTPDAVGLPGQKQEHSEQNGMSNDAPHGDSSSFFLNQFGYGSAGWVRLDWLLAMLRYIAIKTRVCQKNPRFKRGFFLGGPYRV